MVLVIVEGAIVRATGSGNGCGDHWPLCNNQLIPHHPRLTTIIEFTHRSLTGICTALVIVLIAWTFRETKPRHHARRFAVWTGLLLIVEGALGAVLVLGHYTDKNASNMRVFVQSIHFTSTMMLLGAMALTWRALTPQRYPLQYNRSVRKLVVWNLAANILAGAAGSVAALADTIFPSPSLRQGLEADFDPASPLIVHMRWVHPAAALLATVLVLMLATRIGPLQRARKLFALILLQVMLGVADILLLAPVTLQALHLLVADLLWIALISLSAEALTRPDPRPDPQPDLRPDLQATSSGLPLV